MAQPEKPAKQLQPADLPDPLGDSQDIPMASADDLLSEIVGDDVERLMSGEYDPIVPTRRPVDQLQQQLGSFLEELRQREGPASSPPAARHASHVPLTRRPAPAPVAKEIAKEIAKEVPPAPAAPQASPAPFQELLDVQEVEDDFTPPLDDLVGPSHEELVGLHSGDDYEPTNARGPAESRALLAPVDAAASDPAYLKPLDWVSGPVAAMSGRARIAVSMLAVMSFLGGCAALGYVLILRHGV